jgi:HEAT repeat protein
LAVVEALGKLASPGAMLELVKAIEDPASNVRMAAVKYFALSRHMGGFPKIEAAVTGKELRRAELVEKTAFFEAYGTLAGEQGIAVLDPMLNGSGIMKKKGDAELRACAAIALGKIGTPAAIDCLKKSEKDKDPVVRNAVNHALRGDEGGERGSGDW